MCTGTEWTGMRARSAGPTRSTPGMNRGLSPEGGTSEREQESDEPKGVKISKGAGGRRNYPLYMGWRGG